MKDVIFFLDIAIVLLTLFSSIFWLTSAYIIKQEKPQEETMDCGGAAERSFKENRFNYKLIYEAILYFISLRKTKTTILDGIETENEKIFMPKYSNFMAALFASFAAFAVFISKIILFVAN